MTWPEMVAWLDLDNPADKKDCGGYVLGDLEGERRKKDSVLSRSAVALDADKASKSFVADSTASVECALAFYTTWSHTPEKPRWRLLAPLSRDVQPGEYRLIVQALMVELGMDQFDQGSSQPERLMHRPSAQGGAYEHHVIDGEPLDADHWLVQAKELGLENEPEPEPYIYDGPTRPADLGLHWYAKAAIEGELARLDTCDLLGWNSEPWDNTTFAVACKLIEFANSSWSGYDLAVAYGDLMERAPVDLEFGPRKHAVKWASALNKVGHGTRRCPASSAAEDFAEPLAADFFDATPVLQHIRQAAHCRLISAPAMLCYVLARVLTEVPPRVTLPPVVGSRASLNLGFAVVGKSGAGKSATLAASRELLGIVGSEQKELERNVGSGEGVAETFLEDEFEFRNGKLVRTGKKRLVPDPRRILMADEIDQLGATQNRSGATISSAIRSALTGGSLGQENATADRKRHVPEGSYRLVLMVGVQPTRSETLLRDADAGTPQRFVWVPAWDATAPAEWVDWPGSLEWSLPAMLPSEIDYPDHIKREVRAVRHRNLLGQGDELEGHRLLTQLKVAAALAFLHGETAITEQWWAIAEQIFASSLWVQRECQRVLAEEAGKEGEQRARAAGRAAVITAEVVDTDRSGVARASKAILRKVSEAGTDGVSWAEARLAVQHKDRDAYALKARNGLESSGLIRVEDVSVGNRKGERLWADEA